MVDVTLASKSDLAGNRFLFRFGAAAGVMAPVHRLNISLVALLTSDVDCRFSSAAALPRAELTKELTLLSHMLINGFFFNQGFDTRVSFARPCRGLLSVVSEKMSAD